MNDQGNQLIAGPTAPNPQTGSTSGRNVRWLVLATVTAASVVVTLDTTILNVAVPTIARDLHTDLANMQWVLSGYSLTLGALLIVGGRLGDLFGTRRMFIVGALMFATGSLLASSAKSLWTLIIGESIIEGVGAALLFPAALATVSRTFTDRERPKAFAVMGGAAGAAAAFGPVIGGWLTTDFSWRWGLRINVVVAPLSALVALKLLPRADRSTRRARLDVSGAVAIAIGLFMLVFAITEGTTYGWWSPRQDFTIRGQTIWSSTAPVSLVPVAFLAAIAAIVVFIMIERRKERDATDPLVAFADVGRPTFRFGLATGISIVMAQAGAVFVLAVFLQTTHHLSAARTGLWLLPVGVGALIGAQLGGSIAGKTGAVILVRVGICTELIGLAGAAVFLDANTSVAALAPWLALFGVGAGLANSQLTNVILSTVPRERAGSASGVTTANSTIGAALGVAVIGTVLRTANGPSAIRLALATAAIVAAIGALAALAIPRTINIKPTS